MPIATKARRTNRLNIRATKTDKKLLETAAARQETTVSDFVLEAARSRAELVLTDERNFELPPDRWKAFVAALDRPAQTKPRLKKLLTEPTILED